MSDSQYAYETFRYEILHRRALSRHKFQTLLAAQALFLVDGDTALSGLLQTINAELVALFASKTGAALSDANNHVDRLVGMFEESVAPPDTLVPLPFEDVLLKVLPWARAHIAAQKTRAMVLTYVGCVQRRRRLGSYYAKWACLMAADQLGAYLDTLLV
jgi:hypothetical protein